MDFSELLELKDFIFSLKKDLSEEKFIDAIYFQCNLDSKGSCPHCKSKSIVKYGLNALKNQRYKCKECGKYFCNRTNTPMSYSKKSMQSWFEYFKLMCETNTIRTCAKEVKLNVATSFQWRHKILNSVMPMLPSKLKGVVEISELFFAESFKGKHGKDLSISINRAPRKRGLTLGQYLNCKKVSVLCCKDRDSGMFNRVADMCKTRFPQMLSLLEDKITKGSVLCTNNNLGYVSLANKLNCKLFKMRDQKEVKDEQYHIQNASAMANYIENSINYRFRGVATKYLNFYLSWLQWLEAVKNKDGYAKLLNIISICLFSNSKLRVFEFKAVKAL